MKAEGKRRAILAVLAVLAIAGIANADLVAYYDFGTASPSTVNLGTAGSAADGVLMNGATIVDVDPDPRGAEYVLKLDYGDGTVHQYMNCGMDWANWGGEWHLEPLTIAAWIQVAPGTVGDWRTIMSKGYEESWCLATGTQPNPDDDMIAFSAHRGLPSWSPIFGTTGVRDGYWHHVVGTVIDVGHANLYIDSVLQGSSGCWNGVNYSERNILIGDDPTQQSFDYQWNGMIDEVRVYDTAMDAQDVLDLFNSTYSPFRLIQNATNPSPADDATDVSVEADLSWSAGSGAASHDVYFGTISPGSFQGNQTETTFDPGIMANNTTYYWRIDGVHVGGTTTGTVWSFTTEAVTFPPGQASNPSPGNGATGVSVDADLSWSAGPGATSHDVYFGRPGAFQGNQTETTFDPGIMANNTTYYWRIDGVNAGGTTAGTVWSFTTGAFPPGPGLVAYYNFGTASPSTANLGSAGSAADGVLMNGATIVDLDPDPRGAEYVLNLDYGDGTVHQYMDCGMDWANWNGLAGNLQPLTIAAWIQVSPGTVGNWRTIMSKGYEESWCLAMGTQPNPDDDMIAFSAHRGLPSWSPIIGSVNVRDGWWHHVAGVVVSEQLAELYIDGVLQGSSGCWSGVNYSERNILIGDEPTGQDHDFSWNGMIDEVRIYNEALDEDAVQGLYYDYVDRYPYPPIPVSLEVTGPAEVAENSQAQYAATACMDYHGNPDCCDVDVTENATWWIEPETFASIDENGLLTVESLDTSQSITIYAQYTFSGITVEAEMAVLCLAGEYHVDGVNGSDGNDGFSRETAFATIQKGIDTAQDGHAVLVWPAVYQEAIYFDGKAITVKSAADAAVLQAPSGYACSFYFGEDANSVLKNFVIANSEYGVYLENGSTPILSNLTVVNNDFGISAYYGSDPNISNCILWYNSDGDLFQCQARYSCIEETGAGEGNISSDPLFADPCNGDYHLKSRNGRWYPDSETWVTDDNTSPCVNAGDVAFDPMDEPDPNGGRINMGAYGGTAYASMTAIGDYYVIEDFESYSATGEVYPYEPGDLRYKWDPTGLTFGFYGLNSGYQYSGAQCLYINYWTYDAPYYCGVSRTETPWVPADWTFAGTAEILSLWFRGDPNLAAHGVDEIYVRLKDSSNREALVYYTDSWPVEDFGTNGYQQWNIGLEEFTDDNPSIDLTDVKMLEMGIGDGLGNPPAQPGEGFIYFDDIRLYPRRCIHEYGYPEADINNDCIVDEVDLSIMTGDWLDCDYSIIGEAVAPDDPDLVAHWKLDESDPCTVAVDSSGNGHHGTVVGNPVWESNGKVDGAIEIPDGMGWDLIDCGGGKNEGEPNTWADIEGEITVTAWVRPYLLWWHNLGASVVNKGVEEAWGLGKLMDGREVSFYVDVPEVPWYGVRGQTDIFDLKWHHVAGVYEIHQPGVSSEVIVYTDGAKDGSLACSGSLIGTSDKDVFIGDIYTLIQVAHGWRGHIDDVRIYDRALSHSEIVGIVKEATIGPLASYEFESETGGITPDSSGGHDGTLVNGASIVYDADRDSNVLELDGIDEYVDCGGGHDLGESNCTDEPGNCTWADITGGFSVMAWVKPDISEPGNYRAVVVGKGDDGGYHRDYPGEPNRPREGWALQRVDWNNEVSFTAMGSGSTSFTPTSGVPIGDVNMWDGKWHHVATVYDNEMWIDLYVDGIKVEKHWAKAFNDANTIGTTNYPIWIGANVGEVMGGGSYADGYHGWKGRIDDVRIYDRALTWAEVSNAMSGADLYVPLTSLANLYDEELVNNKIINFRDYQLLANDWLEDDTFPFRN